MTRKNSLWHWLGYAALALTLYALFLIVFAPADYFARSVAALTRNAVIIQHPSGSFWRGSGTLLLTNAASTGRIQWSLQPWRIVMGSIGAELQLNNDDTDVRATVELGLRRHVLRDVTAAAPVHVIAKFVPLVDAMGFSGRVRLTAPSIALSKEELQGSGELLWEDAATRMFPLNPAGSYNVQFTGQGKRATLSIGTVQGALRITGQGEWRPFEDGILKLQGNIALSSPQPALEPMLSALGPAQADGSRAFNYEMPLTTLQPAILFP